MQSWNESYQQCLWPRQAYNLQGLVFAATPASDFVCEHCSWRIDGLCMSSPRVEAPMVWRWPCNQSVVTGSACRALVGPDRIDAGTITRGGQYPAGRKPSFAHSGCRQRGKGVCRSLGASQRFALFNPPPLRNQQRHGRFGSNFQFGFKYCIAIASRAPSPTCL